jgi:hypothetical protein
LSELTGPLVAILPLFPRRFQFPTPIGLNLLLMSGEDILRRDMPTAKHNDCSEKCSGMANLES